MSQDGMPPVPRAKTKREPRSFPPLPEVLALFARLRNHDHAVVAPLCEIFEPLLFGVVAGQQGNGPARADLLGEAYLLLYALLLKFDPGLQVHPLTYVRATLPRAVANLVRRHSEKARWETPVSSLIGRGETDAAHVPPDVLERPAPWAQAAVEPDPHAQNPEQIALGHLAWEESFAGLSPHQRRVLCLRSAGFTFAEIAVVLHGREDALRQAYHRACHRVQLHLEAECREGEPVG